MSEPLKPLQSKDGDPIFEAAWQAEALGMADILIAQGVFSAQDWAENLGTECRNAPDSTEGYYTAVLSTLEHLLAQNGISLTELSQTKEAWSKAYISTPHGQPVRLQD